MPSNQTMNAKVYKEVLKKELLPFVRTHEIDYFLQSYGAPCHTAKSVKKWLEDSGVNVIGPWPGSSPDLNPIENLWVNMKMKVAEQNPTSFENLKSIVEKVWLETPIEYCKKTSTINAKMNCYSSGYERTAHQILNVFVVYSTGNGHLHV